MTIEALYEGMNHQDFYIGKVTQVYRSNCIAQIDNFALMSDRSKFNKSFLPNTINNFVLVDSTVGIFLGEVFENKASRKNVFDMTSGAEKAKDYQEICIDTIAIMAPDTPAKKELVTKLIILCFARLIPMASAAISSSRMALNDRP